MPTIRRSSQEPYTAAQMYALVNDVASYPVFLPWCKNTKVIHQTDTQMIAAIEVAKGPLHKWFETRNELIKDHCIQLNLHSGPFKELKGKWQFNDNDKGCLIDFELTFAFAIGPLGLIAEPVFHNIASTMVSAFSARAKEIYS